MNEFIGLFERREQLIRDGHVGTGAGGEIEVHFDRAILGKLESRMATVQKKLMTFPRARQTR